MSNYELLYIIHPTTTDEEKKTIVTGVQSWIESGKGVVASTDEWGIRDLATEFKKCNKGYYVLVKFEIEPGQIQEINRRFRINEKILRYLITSKSEKPTLEAAVRK